MTCPEAILNIDNMTKVSASLFKWHKGFGNGKCSDLGLTPYRVGLLDIESPKTGKVVRFELDQEEAINNECWDGEFTILRSADKKFAVQVWNY